MEILLAVVATILGMILLTLWVVLYQLVKQQGRMLLRLDGVEHRLAHAGMGGSANGLAMLGARSGPPGLAVGTPFPPFRLPDLTGKEISLEGLRGKRVLVIHWSPGCGYCTRIAPELAELQAELRGRDVQGLILSRGDAEANRQLAEQNGLDFPILLAGDDAQVPEPFRQQGTPVAYLLDDQGRVAQPLAVGYVEVPALARRAVGEGPTRSPRPGEKPLSESKLVRDGLGAGTPAPAFRLPDILGGTVGLEDYRGRSVLLVFSDPHCGPCEHLAPELVRLHREEEEGGPSLVLVSRGDPEENRRKAEEHGFAFPVVLQKRWELSRDYGIFETPVAFLIDEAGVIARDVARGVGAILTLARDGRPSGRRVIDGRILR